MSEYDESNQGGILETYLQEVRAEVIRTRARYRTESSSTPNLEHHLRELTIQYYELLREYRDETAVKEVWESTDVDELDDLLTQTVPVQQPTPGHGTTDKIAHVRRIEQVDGERLAQLTEDLDKIANAMNISITVPDRTPNDRVDTDDLRQLLERRGQQDAADRVPKRGGET